MLPRTSSTEDYCRPLDLSCRIPSPDIEAAIHSGKLLFFDVGGTYSEESSTAKTLRQITQVLKAEKVDVPFRICIPSLGSPQWGALENQVV
jgi:elongator complex protein 4